MTAWLHGVMATARDHRRGPGQGRSDLTHCVEKRQIRLSEHAAAERVHATQTHLDLYTELVELCVLMCSASCSSNAFEQGVFRKTVIFANATITVGERQHRARPVRRFGAIRRGGLQGHSGMPGSKPYCPQCDDSHLAWSCLGCARCSRCR